MKAMGNEIIRMVANQTESIQEQMKSRGHRGAIELTNAAKEVLQGFRTGKRYPIRGGRIYTASAPGEPPAMRTGEFRDSFKGRTFARRSYREIHVHILTESGLQVGKYILGELLERGTKKMAARPFIERTREQAKPKIESIFDEPY